MTPPEPDGPVPEDRHPGERLAAARRAQNLSVPVLADALKIAPGVIEAIEAGAYDRFENPTFLRGYVRALARRLHLPADELVTALGPYVDPSREVVPTVLSPNTPPIAEEGLLGRQAGVLLALLTAAALVLVAMGVWVVLPNGTPAPEAVDNVFADLLEGRDGSGRGDRSPPIPEPERRVLPGTGAREPEADAVVPLPQAPPRGAGARAPFPEEGAPAVAGPDSPARAPAAGPGATDPEPGDAGAGPGTVTDALTLRFSGECWTEIRDATDRNVFFDLGRPGEVAEVSGVPPFRILLGNAPAVELAYNGDPVALSAFTRRDNTANLVIGQ